jgi:large subunit ribosomal protein L36|mmetsp:Transcript_41211/g.132479  ORF Transcript_41211/g.132479 Transcript_41211/m.132479 type:complete len:86 (+) Transcript_41211:15-272(+)
MFGVFAAARSLVAPKATAPLAALAQPPLGGLQAAFARRWMKVKSSVRRRCEDCYIVRRGKINYNYCRTHGRHKHRQGPKRKAARK